MTGPVDQCISLASYGNEFLKSGQLISFYPENRSFQFCKRVLFSETRKDIDASGSNESVNTFNPNTWFDFLKKNNCIKIRLAHFTSEKQVLARDYQLAGFVGGGGPWLIETVFEKSSDLWANNWQVTNRHDPERKIWTVQYVRIKQHVPSINLQFDPVEIKNDLNETLTAISAFAEKQKLNFWKDWFDRAIKTLQSQNPEALFFRQDMLVQKNHPLIARQLIYGGGNSFVFGGMGSWNDISFQQAEIQKEYEKISAQLYDIMNQAILCGINYENHEIPGQASNN